MIQNPSLIQVSLFVFTLCGSLFANGSFASYSHPHTMRNTNPLGLVEIQSLKIRGDAFRSHGELRCGELKDYCPTKGWALGDTNSAHIRLSPLLGAEYRQLDSEDDKVQAVDGGLEISGFHGPASFWLDMRIFTENHSKEGFHSKQISWDREFQEVQNDATTASTSYVSYARYRMSFALETALGTIAFRRDPVGWGPSTYHQLTFSSQAVPFNHVMYQLDLGPVRIMSLWGILSVVGNEEFAYSEDTRSVYGHRYEWRITPNLLLGVSEQLITFNSEAPMAVVPVVPLFMEKGQNFEADNNGNIAMDLSWFYNERLMIYGEFLVDDLQDPGTLFDDFWGNRWALSLGSHYTFDWKEIRWNALLEYARVEPWVYAHYKTETAQAAHRGYPLGEQLGPNSQALTLQLSAQQKLKNWSWQAYLLSEIIWKGSDPGSDIMDGVREYSPKTKTFLANTEPELIIEPGFALTWKFLTLDQRTRFKDNGEMDWVTRVHLQW